MQDGRTPPDASGPDHPGSPIVNLLLNICAASYGLYALFLLIEIFDFLSLLHSHYPDENPTYGLINVMYYVMDMIICTAAAFVFIVSRFTGTNQSKISSISIAVTIARSIAIYYLYIFTVPEYRWVPYIYKVGNELSDAVRAVALPLQILLGVASAWACWRHRIRADNP